MADHAGPSDLSATTPRGAKAILRLLRPGDWVKNVFVLIPIVFYFAGEGRGADAEAIRAAIFASAIAFVCFCMAASGFYAVNDALDAPEDRTHPVKRRRPVASGAITPGSAITLGAALIAGAMLLALTVNHGLALTVALYALLQVGYNLRLKRVPFVDVASISLGFCLRAIGGAVAIQVPISIWLLLCVFFLTLYLGFIKRLCDLASADAARRRGDAVEWKPRAGYEHRDELNWLLAMSGVMTILMYLMYALSDHAKRLFGERAIGFALLSPLVVVVIHRFFRRANLARSDSPLGILTEDRTVLVAVLLFAAGTLVTLFVPQVAPWFAKLVAY
ncbi:MAG: UbiA prenyltransferase family protein [Phycisphaeraceae bacterium]|nr:UbiA prenyltransferase family protein [Phycisphaeraceae bacterium]